jgi:hypothetical protein
LSSGCRQVERRRNMTYYASFEPFAIRNHNEEVFREVSDLRLEKRLRRASQPRYGRRFALPFMRMLAQPR